MDMHLLDSCGKSSSRKFTGTWIGKKVPNWECLFVHRKQGLFLSKNVDDIKMVGKKQNMAPMWKKLMMNVDLDEPTTSLDRVIWVALNVKHDCVSVVLGRRQKCMSSCGAG